MLGVSGMTAAAEEVMTTFLIEGSLKADLRRPIVALMAGRMMVPSISSGDPATARGEAMWTT